MDTETENLAILKELKYLNRQIETQYSYHRSLLQGIVYGIGFIIGSTVIATLAIGYLLPSAIQIPWLHDNFVRGAAVMMR